MVYAREKNGRDMYYYNFEWDFGDNMTPPVDGTSASHIYMQPGTYVIKLSVNHLAYTRTITVTGNPTKRPPSPAAAPVLELKFENTINDTSPKSHGVNIQGGQALFTCGVEGSALDLTNGTHIVVSGPLDVTNGITVSFWVRKAVASSNSPETFMYKSAASYAGPELHLHSHINSSFGQHYYGSLKTLNVSSAVGMDAWQGITSLMNIQWHHYVMVYDGNQIKLYVDGSEYFRDENPDPVLLSGLIENSSNDLYIGCTAAGEEHFNGYLDEIKIYDRALDPRDIFVGFELWHANFHNRIAQYLYAQIPDSVSSNPANRLRVTITGDTGYSGVLIDKTNLSSEEKFLLNNASLPAGNYQLSAEIRDAGSALIESLTEKFSKPYDGQPVVGFDENNAIRVNGELIFPITPFGLNAERLASWSQYINSLFTQGFFPDDFTIPGWTTYLDQATAHNMRVIGPTSWEGLAPRGYMRNSTMDKLIEYVETTRNSNGLFMWTWVDEPDLGTRAQEVPPTVQRSWALACQARDPQHPVAVNYTGYKWCQKSIWGFNDRQRYSIVGFEKDALGTGHDLFNYYGNARLFGKRVLLHDMFGFDYYPMDFAPRMGTTYTELCAGWDNLKNETYNLVPYISWIETTDIHEDELTPWAPTPAQLKMNIWLNVVHGVKHIGWFHYFDPTPDENFAVMAEFKSQMTGTNLMRAILGPPTDITVTVNAAEGRVDAMVKEYGGLVYLIAVRLTELIPGTGNSEQVSNPAVTFLLNTPTVDGTADVFNEGRTVPITGGTSLIDNFTANQVHIYTFTR